MKTEVFSLFSAIFNWFPVTMPIPWIMFFICFFVCTLISTIISILKERSENKRMKEALEKMKEESL